MEHKLSYYTKEDHDSLYVQTNVFTYGRMGLYSTPFVWNEKNKNEKIPYKYEHAPIYEENTLFVSISGEKKLETKLHYSRWRLILVDYGIITTRITAT